jgi:hypothetical protein
VSGGAASSLALGMTTGDYLDHGKGHNAIGHHDCLDLYTIYNIQMLQRNQSKCRYQIQCNSHKQTGRQYYLDLHTICNMQLLQRNQSKHLSHTQGSHSEFPQFPYPHL